MRKRRVKTNSVHRSRRECSNARARARICVYKCSAHTRTCTCNIIPRRVYAYFTSV